MSRTVTPQLDEEARIFAELYRPLRRFAAVVGPVEMDPDDLLQEAVARALRRGGLCRLENPAAYLRKTMVNLASNQRRRLAISRKALTRLSATNGQPSRDAYPSDLHEVMRLPSGERAVLYLSEVEGYRYAEIGQILGCSEAAARKRALRARRRLFAALSGEVTGG